MRAAVIVPSTPAKPLGFFALNALVQGQVRVSRRASPSPRATFSHKVLRQKNQALLVLTSQGLSLRPPATRARTPPLSQKSSAFSSKPAGLAALSQTQVFHAPNVSALVSSPFAYDLRCRSIVPVHFADFGFLAIALKAVVVAVSPRDSHNPQRRTFFVRDRINAETSGYSETRDSVCVLRCEFYEMDTELPPLKEGDTLATNYNGHNNDSTGAYRFIGMLKRDDCKFQNFDEFQPPKKFKLNAAVSINVPDVTSMYDENFESKLHVIQGLIFQCFAAPSPLHPFE
ncbi:hypothetical protein HDU83_005719 [Entophlyctis luteolus]|nr:hypothetical protein HDU83_005719 [Entophlyctis luteolus]